MQVASCTMLTQKIILPNLDLQSLIIHACQLNVLKLGSIQKGLSLNTNEINTVQHVGNQIQAVDRPFIVPADHDACLLVVAG